MKQIFSEEITTPRFKFLNQPRELYEKSRFLRNIRQSYLMYKTLTQKQIQAFQKTIQELKNPLKKEEKPLL